jgi:uncharacterized membrane protein (DUF106 family)|tara:strand:- start:539 stop:943 length:405 start_codon:yes stop_codon:yes gene_type:complete
MALRDFFILNPKISVIGISFLITFIMTIITKYFTDQARMKELKGIQKKHQKDLKENKGNIEKQKEIQGEIMKLSMELMKHSFKPLLITFLPLILLIWWLRGIFVETAIENTWIWWYIGVSLISSLSLRKLMDVA